MMLDSFFVIVTAGIFGVAFLHALGRHGALEGCPDRLTRRGGR
jgi:hypothetical protein